MFQVCITTRIREEKKKEKKTDAVDRTVQQRIKLT